MKVNIRVIWYAMFLVVDTKRVTLQYLCVDNKENLIISCLLKVAKSVSLSLPRPQISLVARLQWIILFLHKGHILCRDSFLVITLFLNGCYCHYHASLSLVPTASEYARKPTIACETALALLPVLICIHLVSIVTVARLLTWRKLQESIEILLGSGRRHENCEIIKKICMETI